MPLNENQERLLFEIANQVKNNEGVLTQELLDKLYQNDLSNPDFNNFFKNNLIPNLSEKELFNLTLSFLQAHVEKDNSLLLANDNHVTTLLYDAFRSRINYIPENESPPMNALHWRITQSYVKHSNKPEPPFASAGRALEDKYPGDHSKAFGPDVRSDYPPSTENIALKTRPSVLDRMTAAVNSIPIRGTRVEHISKLEGLREKLEKELKESPWNRERKQIKRDFVYDLLYKLNNPLNANVPISVLIQNTLSENSNIKGFNFETVTAGRKSKVEIALREICGKDDYMKLINKLNESPQKAHKI